MISCYHSPWAIVLAAGDGSRLASLTAGDAGEIVPKQFCSLRGGRTLLGDALLRARGLTPAERTLAVVSERHRPYWDAEFEDLPAQNVVVQPGNRGTAAGLLLPLLAVLARDPAAAVVVLPSDHHVREEPVLRVALRLALQHAAAHAGCICMLGMVPDAPTSDYGWILPRKDGARMRRVERFVEKPGAGRAGALLQQGALWNSFILAGTGRAFLNLYVRRQPALLELLAAVQRLHPRVRSGALRQVYDELPQTDFSRDIVEGSEEHLRVIEVPPCGWTDLGTPGRVAECLRDGPGQRALSAPGGRRPVLLERLAQLQGRAHAERRPRARLA